MVTVDIIKTDCLLWTLTKLSGDGVMIAHEGERLQLSQLVMVFLRKLYYLMRTQVGHLDKFALSDFNFTPFLSRPTSFEQF